MKLVECLVGIQYERMLFHKQERNAQIPEYPSTAAVWEQILVSVQVCISCATRDLSWLGGTGWCVRGTGNGAEKLRLAKYLVSRLYLYSVGIQIYYHDHGHRHRQYHQHHLSHHHYRHHHYHHHQYYHHL